MKWPGSFVSGSTWTCSFVNLEGNFDPWAQWLMKILSKIEVEVGWKSRLEMLKKCCLAAPAAPVILVVHDAPVALYDALVALDVPVVLAVPDGRNWCPGFLIYVAHPSLCCLVANLTVARRGSK
jgi:hypothetical protein